jgi:hypothetical protein
MKSIHLFINFMVLWSLLCIISRLQAAQTYTVDQNHPSAADSNPGTLNAPWLTIRHAAETAGAGDQVFIRAGVYYETIYFDQSGNEDAPVIYSAYAGEKPVIDGTGVTDSQNGLVIDKSYIKISGLELRNWNDNAIWVENAHHLEISDCEVHDVWCGIGLADGTHDFTLNRIEAHHFTLYGFDASPSTGSNCYNGTFNDCMAYTGRDRDQNVDGFALGHGTQHDFVFNRCTTYDVYDGFDISSASSTLNRCLAYNCWNGAYKLWQDQVRLINCIGYDCGSSVAELDWDGTPGTVTLLNCTFYGGVTFTVWVENKEDALHMSNCIVAGGDNIGLAFEQMGVANYRGDYNIFHNANPNRAVAVGYTDEFTLGQVADGTWTAYSGQDTHSLTVNSDAALFIDPDNFDLHPKSAGPAVDQGTNTGAPSEDYEGHPRPSGAGVDIGSYEVQMGTGLLPSLNENAPDCLILGQNYPNPFNPYTTIPFSLPKTSFVSLKVFDILGNEVASLVNETRAAGEYSLGWNTLNLAAGIYFLCMQAGEFTETRKLIIQK